MKQSKVTIDNLSKAVMEELENYKDLTTTQIKSAVKKTDQTVRKEIANTAPQRSGKYAKSWRVKTTRETDHSLVVVIHSPTRYQLAHLLEFGHAKRGGGRTKAFPHIERAENVGMKQFEDMIEEALNG